MGIQINGVSNKISSGSKIDFPGSVGVAGTLTYEDVANVDSVGLITARGGIRIGAGTTVGPISGIVTYFGDGSQLTGISAGPGTGESYVILRDQSNPPALSDTGRNIIIGHNAAHKYGNGSATGGNENVFLGYTAGFQQTGGDGNVYVGAGAGANNLTSTGNVYVGQEAGRNATGQDNICIGRFAGNVGGFTGSNNLVFGYNSDPSSANVSNEITLGNANINHLRVPGIGVSFSNNGAVIAGVVTATSFDGAIPSGVIVMWSGASNAIPTGFVLCNGQNSTPDLRNRFVVGATDTYSVGATGGATSTNAVLGSVVVYTGTEDNPNQVQDASSSYNGIQNKNSRDRHQHGTDINHTHSNIATLPPYYALCYIMKT